MKKIFSLFAAILFAGSMMAAEYELVYTLTPEVSSASGSSAYATAVDIPVDGITWNVMGNTTMTPWRIGGKNLNGVDRSLYSKTAIEENIAKIEIKHEGASSVTVNSMTVVVATNSNFAEASIVSTLTPTFVATGTVTVTRPEEADWSNCYYKVTYNVKIGSSNKFIAFAEAKFYEVASTDPAVVVDPTSWDFGTVGTTDAVSKVFSVSGANLTAGDLTLSVPAGFSVSPSTITLEAAGELAATNVTVSKNTTEAGAYAGNLSISGCGLASAVNVALSMELVAPVAVESIELNKTSVTLEVAQKQQLEATVKPDEATNKAVTWESSAEAIATVDEDGLVTAIAVGSATITCKSVADNTITATCAVTVTQADVVLDFTSNDGWNFPTDSKETTEATFTKGDYSVTLGGGYQYYTGEILIGKTNAYMKLPVFANNAIAKIVTVGTETGAAGVTFNVFDGTTAVSTEVTSCKVDQTFIISPKKKNVEYTIKITNNNNARFPKIKIYFGEPDPATAIDNTEATVKAVKFIENGQLFIEKNGHVYNVQGQVVK